MEKNSSTSDYTVKLGYEVQDIESFFAEKKCWWLTIWKTTVPAKAKLTLWIEIKNKMLTLENLMKRGWEGPRWCVFCQSHTKKIAHKVCFMTICRGRMENNF